MSDPAHWQTKKDTRKELEAVLHALYAVRRALPGLTGERALAEEKLENSRLFRQKERAVEREQEAHDRLLLLERQAFALAEELWKDDGEEALPPGVVVVTRSHVERRLVIGSTAGSEPVEVSQAQEDGE